MNACNNPTALLASGNRSTFAHLQVLAKCMFIEIILIVLIVNGEMHKLLHNCKDQILYYIYK